MLSGDIDYGLDVGRFNGFCADYGVGIADGIVVYVNEIVVAEASEARKNEFVVGILVDIPC